MTRVLAVAHLQRPEAVELVRRAAAWLGGRGSEVWMTPADAKRLGLEELADDRPVANADLALSLGGDGTMLRTIELLDGAATPVIGVNVGQLGYLTEVEPTHLLDALDRYERGEFGIEERMLLDVVLERCTGERVQRRALNEAVIEKCESGHTVRLRVSIDGSVFTTYVADGLIVATPTGSTAYSLSARGPIVSPKHRAVLLTPVSPHMLFDRSLVLDPDEEVAIELDGHRSADVSVDGHKAATLAEGDRVRCRASAATAHLVRFGRQDFHRILKAKFGLSDR